MQAVVSPRPLFLAVQLQGPHSRGGGFFHSPGSLSVLRGTGSGGHLAGGVIVLRYIDGRIFSSPSSCFLASCDVVPRPLSSCLSNSEVISGLGRMLSFLITGFQGSQEGKDLHLPLMWSNFICIDGSDSSYLGSHQKLKSKS